jgi:phage baseplate assembly protein W
MDSYNITFPFQDDTITNSFISMNQVSKDSYSSNLLLLLLTQKNERYYEPDYGTNLLKYIFEPNDNISATQVEEEIRDTVGLYIPEVKITSVTFNWNNDEEGQPISENQLNINIQFIYTEGSLSEQGNLDLNF